MTVRTVSAVRRVCATGLLAAASLSTLDTPVHAGPAPAAIECDSTYDNFKWPDANGFGWLTADAGDSGTVHGTGYTLSYTYDFDFTTMQATIHVELTSTTYALTGTILWYVRTPDDGGLPIWDNYGDSPTSSRDSVIVFNRSDFKALYALSWRLQPCTDPTAEPTPDPTPQPTPDPTPQPTPAETAPTLTEPETPEQTPVTTATGASGGILPETGADGQGVAWLGAALTVGGVGAIAIGRRRTRCAE